MCLFYSTNAKISSFHSFDFNDQIDNSSPLDTPTTKKPQDVKLRYPFKDKSLVDPLENKDENGLKLKEPSNINTTVDYDPATGHYNLSQKMGKSNYRPPSYLDKEEYSDYAMNKMIKDYWKQRTHAESSSQNKALAPKLHVGGEMFDRIFGGNTVDIRPQGSAELIFAGNTSKTDNPALPVRQRKISTFDFDERIQLNVIGNIGDKLKLTTSYNTQSTFDFENQMKLEFNGYEDDIIKKIEAGNVSLPLSGSLITGSQSLFGIKTQLQFGRLTATSVFSQQRGKKSEVEVTGGAQTSKFDVPVDNYEANKHYFLSHYFRDHYNQALSRLPVITSGISINRIEVWVTNKTSTTDNTRNILALKDLGEENSSYLTTNGVFVNPGLAPFPFDSVNTLYELHKNSGIRNVNTILPTLSGLGYNSVEDYEKLENARKLSVTEYTFNQQLGFISLNQALNYDEVLSVAYQYTINGKVYQVGEFSTDGIAAPQTLMVKMLKSTNVSTSSTMWDLMMKNVYSIGAYQVNPQDFKLEVWYNNAATGADINYLPQGAGVTGKPLIQIVDLDRLNPQLSPMPDGVFDFINGVTINAANGRIYFPVLEPFGSDLRKRFQQGEQTIANKYVFEQLYDSTKIRAQQFPDKNRYKIKGTYKSSSSSEISLGAPNVPQGSVGVTAGGIKLTENIDYTVDYNLGRVKIINEGVLNSGTPIKVSLESNSLFSIQSKALFGTHLDYKISNDFTLGGTILNLTERPITKKVNIGDEPISNTIWGLDGNYRTDAPFLTRLVDKIPFIETKAKSSISASGEFAQLVPGHSKAIGKNGNSYIDDFEGSQSAIDIRTAAAWSLASVPQGQPNLFPEGSLTDSLPYGYNRANLAWYVIDPLFLRETKSATPSSIGKKEMSNHQVREILETEIFPNKQNANAQTINIPVFDLAYYPDERGPYNFDVRGLNGISKGLELNGKLKNPETRWAGIMRKIETNDFEASNVEFIQFWMMDPFNSDNKDPNQEGELYFNLGNISEDILKDSRKSFENGLPRSESDNNAPYDITKWGRVPSVQAIVNAFDNDPAARPFQDVGFDGLRDADESSFFKPYLDSLSAYSIAAFNSLSNDPAGDNYHYYRGDDYDKQSLGILERYKKFNGVDGNSPTQEQSNSLNSSKYLTSASTSPNAEDINRDNTLNESESYYQYKIKLTPNDISPTNVGNNYITDVFQTQGQSIKDGTSKPITWYQFRIPVKSFDSKIGTIEDFRSIRFIRMFFKGVDKPVVCRFARLELIRSEWRKYNSSLLYPGDYQTNDDEKTSFNVSAVNIEENGSKIPVNYVLPPGIDRETNVQSANLAKLNEQAMSIRVCNLEDGDSRATFKNTDFDVRSYKKIQMYVHAEAGPGGDVLKDGDLTMFIRLGTDYTSNYYEYEIPLKVTAPGKYNATSSSDQSIVWPEVNNLILSFDELQKAKQKRNLSGAIITNIYSVNDPNYPANKIYVVGNPNLSTIKTIMIGVRNPKKTGATPSDDGFAKCTEVWINELRLTDFDQKGGWATNASITARLADFGTFKVAGSMSTPGFGSIEKKVSERQRATLQQYDLSSNLELGKFFPESINLKIPMYLGYSEAINIPQFNPLDPDILLKPVLKDPTLSKQVRDSLRYITTDYTRRKSINFTNVKKEKGKNSKKSHVYDIENFAGTYSYNEIFRRNINIEYNSTKNYRAGLIYGFSPMSKNIKPFEKSKVLSSKYLSLIKDINFNTLPSRFGFSVDVDRQFNEAKNRNTTGSEIIILPTYNKTFNMTRNYDLKYDLTKALKLDYTATNESRILEPDGKIDTQEKKDSIKESFLSLGKNMHYKQVFNANYAIPINKLPLLDFTNASVRYSANYDWTRAPIGYDSLGNTIQNARSVQWTGQFNLLTLYNKVPYLKRINQKPVGGNNNASSKDNKKIKLNANSTKEDSIKAKKEEDNNKFQIVDYVAKLIMTFKTASFSYANNDGIILPGYSQGTDIIGLNKNTMAPGVGFVFGSQDDIRQKAINNDWLTRNELLNKQYLTTSSEVFNARANAEPFNNLKIEFTASRNSSKNKSEYFRWNNSTGEFVHDNPSESGNFSMSYLTWRTSFKNENKDHFSSVFQDFLDNRSIISARLGEKHSSGNAPIDGYADGYNAISQDVLIPAFLAAYSGKSANKITLDAFPKIPLPNWRITYDGFMKFEVIKNRFKSFTIGHAYRSSYNVGGYAYNLRFIDNGDGYTWVRDASQNFISQKQISGVTISEQYSPLIKVDMTFNNSLIGNIELKKDRNLSLGLTSYQLTEDNGKEIVVGTGYRLKDVSLGPNIKMKGKTLKSDVNIKVDVSFRNKKTVIRKIVEEVNQIVAGQNTIAIKTSADYVLNERLNLRLFYDQNINKPQISSSYPTSNANYGVSIRFTLSQ